MLFRSGRTATVRFQAWDESATLRVDVQVRRGTRVLAKTVVTARGTGTVKTARLRLPLRTTGALTVWVRARDTSGNATAWTRARLLG